MISAIILYLTAIYHSWGVCYLVQVQLVALPECLSKGEGGPWLLRFCSMAAAAISHHQTACHILPLVAVLSPPLPPSFAFIPSPATFPRFNPSPCHLPLSHPSPCHLPSLSTISLPTSPREPPCPQIAADRLTKIAARNWSQAALDSKKKKRPAFKSGLVTRIYKQELGGGRTAPPLLKRVMLLEVSQYLENYLWPNFDAATATLQHLMSIILMVNEKFRESIPAWTAFHTRKVRGQSGSGFGVGVCWRMP
jgi:hypothetical protein